MTIHRTNFADSLAPGFRQLFMDALAFGEKPPVMESVFNVTQSEPVAYVKDSYVTGFGLLEIKNESTASSYDDIYEGLDTTYTFVTRSLAYRITKEWVEDERYGLMQKLPKALGRSTRASVETDASNILNNGFVTTYNTGADGKELFATDHLYVTGGTYKNELTTAAELSATSYEQALIDIKDMRDDRGIMLDLKPKKIVYPNELAWTVKKLFGSDKDPTSANNTINPMADEKLQHIEWSYLTDPDAWFILCDTHELNWFWRVKPDHYQGNDFDTDDAKFKVRARWDRGWSSPFGVFASPGG